MLRTVVVIDHDREDGNLATRGVAEFEPDPEAGSPLHRTHFLLLLPFFLLLLLLFRLPMWTNEREQHRRPFQCPQNAWLPLAARHSLVPKRASRRQSSMHFLHQVPTRVVVPSIAQKGQWP